MARRRSDEPGRRGYRWRPTKHLELRQRFLIVCEGEKTEPNYFRAFKVPIDVVSVEVVGLGLDPLNLIKEAVARKGKAAANGNPYDQVWCVFDRDSWTLQDFN